MLWVAQVTPGDQPKGVEPLTNIRVRPVQTARWKELAHFNGIIVSLAEQNDTLLAVQDDGQWLRIGEGQFSNGLPLPGSGRVLAMAGGGDALWALGWGVPVPTAASQPASLPATGASLSTRPAATRAAIRPLLFRFNGSGWQDLAGMPDNLPPPDARLMSMTLLGDSVAVALLENKAIRTFRFDRAKQAWTDTGSATPDFAVRMLKLFSTPQGLALWATPGASAGELYFSQPAGGWSAPKRIEPPSATAAGSSAAPAVIDATAAAAGDEIRVIVTVAGKNGPQFLEQKYRFDGVLTQAFGILPWPAAGIASSIWWWLNPIITSVLLFLMFNSIRRRRASGPITVDLEKLGIAPLGMRLIAGLIDLLPLAIAILLYGYRNGLLGDIRGLLAALISDPQLVWWQTIPSAIYIAHTLAAEVFLGRSIGKIIVGLEVILLNGARPGAWPLALRNLLRFVDVSFGLFPVALILLSPLRQRVGDAAAGTVVVVKRKAASIEEEA